MKEPTAHPDPTQVDGAAHPRDTHNLIGQPKAEADFLTAYTSDRLHHGWLITGPRGVGKATLAYRIARFLIATPPAGDDMFGAPPPPETLDISIDHPDAQLIAANASPSLKIIKRTPNPTTDKMRDMITAEDVRDLSHFLHMSVADGGRRVVIVDTADEMNATAANALLKMLEEPPAQTTMLLLSHQPSRLLPTIKSRCRVLRLDPLSGADMAAALAQTGIETGGVDTDALSQLSGGSVGEAVRLLNANGLALYKDIIGLIDTLPRLNRQGAMKLAEKAAARGGADTFDLILTLLDIALARLARTGATGTPPPEAAQGEAATLTRLSPTPHAARAWADIATQITSRTRHGKAVNLDPAALVLDTFFKLQDTAAGLAR
jgi:DNA polymerase-3 subunit delta'